MRWDHTEFLLKGIYLGLLLMVALHGPDWWQFAAVGLFMVAGLLVSLSWAALKKWREGYQSRGRYFGYFLFLLLENPRLVYAGVIAGLAAGAYLIFRNQAYDLDLWAVGGGLVLGFLFLVLRTVRQRQTRMWLGLGLAAVLVGAAFAVQYLQGEYIDVLSREQSRMIPIVLLLGIPGFYLLTFASLVEESEVEIAAICAAMGVALGFLGDRFGSAHVAVIGLAIPLLLYFIYTRRSPSRIAGFQAHPARA